MRKPSFTGQFKKDRKRILKRGWDVAHLDEVLERLIDDETLDKRYKTHPLRGSYVGHWECHLEPDFLLIWYYAEGNEMSSCERAPTLICSTSRRRFRDHRKSASQADHSLVRRI